MSVAQPTGHSLRVMHVASRRGKSVGVPPQSAPVWAQVRIGGKSARRVNSCVFVVRGIGSRRTPYPEVSGGMDTAIGLGIDGSGTDVDDSRTFGGRQVQQHG